MANSIRPSQSLASSPSISVLVLELVSAGYFGNQVGDSFRREGRAMLDAVTDDLQRIANVNVIVPGAVACRDETLLQSVAHARADYSLIIAPEFDGLLERFCAAARQSGAKSLNCEPAALALGADKWEFHRHLTQHNLPTISTRLNPLDASPPEFPCVVKPRYGAGSWLVRLVGGVADFAAIADQYRAAGLAEYLCQPVVQGRAHSIAALVASGFAPEILPTAEQEISSDGEFRYLGGRIPVRLPAVVAGKMQSLMSRLVATIPGLNGYVGCDVIVPNDGEPIIVELNPRLTTSYIGYRQLCGHNLMERMFFPDRVQEPLQWNPGIIAFDAAACAGSRLSTLDNGLR